MEHYQLQIIESVLVIAGFIVSLKLTNRIIDKAGMRFSYQTPRVKIIKKIASFTCYVLVSGFLLFIWGVDHSELVFFISSLITVLGIAFFAQWSIISNITSTLIIYFNHQVHIGDHIEVLDNEYKIEGKISDIGIFFVIIKVAEDEFVSLPSNIFMQKMVKKKKEAVS